MVLQRVTFYLARRLGEACGVGSASWRSEGVGAASQLSPSPSQKSRDAVAKPCRCSAAK